MNQQKQLLNDIGMVDFTLVELTLYLDTHPQDTETLMTYSSLRDTYHSLTKEYARRFGPLTFTQVTSDNYWTWISTPWPWEGEC